MTGSYPPDTRMRDGIPGPARGRTGMPTYRGLPGPLHADGGGHELVLHAVLLGDDGTLSSLGLEVRDRLDRARPP